LIVKSPHYDAVALMQGIESSPAFNEIMRSVCEAHFGRLVFDFDEGA
jgi:hypothetical protein